MFDERVFTIDEVAEHFKVPPEAVKDEIARGNMKAITIGGYQRVLESQLNAYEAGANASTQTAKGSIQSDVSVNLGKAADFVHKWPDGKIEKFSDVREGTATYLGRSYGVRVGFTTRESAGKDRRRSLVVIDRYPTVEFVSAGTNGNGLMASIIKDRSGKQVPVGVAPPVEYASLRVGPYQEVVIGPGASNGLAVVCDPDDIETMVRHALIRYRYRRERQ